MWSPHVFLGGLGTFAAANGGRGEPIRGGYGLFWGPRRRQGVAD